MLSNMDVNVAIHNLTPEQIEATHGLFERQAHLPRYQFFSIA